MNPGDKVRQKPGLFPIAADWDGGTMRRITFDGELWGPADGYEVVE